MVLAGACSLGRRLTISSEEGAQPLVALATHPTPHALDGAYFSRLRLGRISRAGRDDALGAALWDRSLALLGER